MTRVLLVDDDRELTEMLSQYLTRESFTVTCTNSAEEGENEALSGRHDIVVLDIMMPRMSGIEVLRRIRAQSQVPVILLTARGDNIDRISGLELGADDYVPKPSSPGELVARLRAIMRRVRAVPVVETVREVIQAGDLTLWPGKREARWQGVTLELTGNEFCLLEELARHAGQLVSKQNLSMNALGRPLARYDRSIDVHISSIRHKLGPRNDNQSWIQSVRNLGYLLITP
ncbi:chemotaxis protein CheY [Pseudomonas amygdali pv. tabaci str. ATCC 11528]|uniref:DNA-binding response regulator CpxR n=3 Tax=Pseudomonas amygdali TaxID=47877 RepID=A0AB37RER9_PSEAV|nr:response regulator transcription factor [Pseudomonas amygdali]ARA82419.1 DNA-binding response regulator [Pseudomonas amygdali pv. lachrymans]AXH57568.1 DNA-binding response regulator [Pseudomonas amygdali pv. lachrymans str. M301315]KEZ64761.1 chemotaxis protein CheY [Pseudomonas amygdali pv. tabaci str. ATCC 11528]KKY52906.1 chemotaxis protein CheY [Pseudomonas amygdali pv. tabaci str. ATCC 11528]KKY56854.1 chemotaxis protein CheY [Pseudomonas amygdali pv. lachrymans]